MDENKVVSATLFLLLLLFCFRIPQAQSQQPYVNNKQLDCENNYNVTDGYVCNGVNKSCLSYLTFKSAPPKYNTPPSIAFLLNSTASLIAEANNISDVDPIPADKLVIVPVTCSCSGNGKYYQHNASYSLKSKDETYFSVANNTYEALTTCQALMAQNPYDMRKLVVGLDLLVPLRCACPTSKQMAAGFNYLLSYLVSEGESIEEIGGKFGVDEQSVKDANELTSDLIFYFTNIMVPLRNQPSKIQNAVPPPSPPPPPPAAVVSPSGDGDSSSSKKWVIVGVAVGAALLVLIGVLVLFFCFYRRRRSELPVATPVLVSDTGATKKSSDFANTTDSWSLSSEGVRYAIDSLTVYKFEELQNATNSFSESNKIKGSVYTASFKGDTAAVKILKGDVSGEINILKRINHTNIIRLSGFCVYKGNTYLVYEFAENGSLDNWLHSNKYENSTTLNWKQRVQIAYDVADVLNYLHNYTNPIHIHKNLNCGNVLLDSNFRAKVSNFGLARAMGNEEEGEFQLTRHVIGTKGYMPPEYLENGVITPKMDVFALGVVILELLSGREAIAGDKNENEQLLSASVVEVLLGDNVREKLRAFMDPTLRNEYPFDLAYSMAQIAKRCVARDLNSRPVTADVFITLSKIHSSTLDWDPSDEYERSGFVSQASMER
ncbi:hypothetical protein L6164_029110 [Bauhinia variegata]|uniref:Uncharacterized protein n=1 Tax=Bauhinia variegata TaxID=167791 RepID=A0ACB9L871_BAUVA|nr:hypothetical protein L6164_029110 [Bauhinia variegata]